MADFVQILELLFDRLKLLIELLVFLCLVLGLNGFPILEFEFEDLFNSLADHMLGFSSYNILLLIVGGSLDVFF